LPAAFDLPPDAAVLQPGDARPSLGAVALSQGPEPDVSTPARARLFAVVPLEPICVNSNWLIFLSLISKGEKRDMNPLRSVILSLSRMPPILMFFIIVGFAVVVTMYVMGLINNANSEADRIKQANAAQQAQKIKVVYAAKNIEEGQSIPAEALEERDVEVAKAPVDAFNSANAVVGQQAAYAVPAGQIVSQHAVKQMAISTTFEGKIKEGMRALTFGVDSNSGVAGFIAPGSHVDVVCITGSGGETKAAPVMSDVEVVAVGTTYQKQLGSSASAANPAGSVTVAVTPEDAIKLIKAISAAKPYLVLRNDKDHSPVAVVDIKDLFPKPKKEVTEVASLPAPNLPPPPLPGAPAGGDVGGAPAGATPPPPPPMHEIEVWSGGKKEVLSVPQG